MRYKSLHLPLVAVLVVLCVLTASVAQDIEHECDVEDWNAADDCTAYGGFFDSSAPGAGFSVYPGAGEMTLSFRRPEVDCSNGNTIVYSPRGVALPADALDKEVIFSMRANNSTPWYMHDPFSMFDIEGWEPLKPDPRTWVPEIPPNARVDYRDLYPGIDFAFYEQQNRREYVYTVRPGAAWSNVSMVVETGDHQELDSSKDLVLYFEGGKIVKHKPIVYQISEEGEVSKQQGSYSLDGGGFGFDFEPALSDLEERQKSDEYIEDPELCLVTHSGDTNGTPYDFNMSKYETSNSRFIDFLNHAQEHTNDAFGTNMWFDSQGNVWINPAMEDQRDELFSIADSRVRYSPQQEIGKRYFLTSKTPMVGGSYSNHPITGVSWYGAVKYCNWLTLRTGRDVTQLAYSEGTNTFDWRPVTCTVTNWIEGKFRQSERISWLSIDGYRLPMDNGSYTNSGANFFNEFSKAATWAG
ncbi:MAG: SUMF1/EgtB/PvdO family nonheme iron enzyme, partial [Kiritimatiellia bacterium]|nr:SUMF1/EgtB/PvdO family nonheme iron enzyme [Kiritimatiellia bacterium]